MKKNLIAVFILFVLGFSPSIACDLTHLDWRNIHLYSCGDFEFKKTTIKSFKSKNKGFNHLSKIKNTTVLTRVLEDSDSYKELRAGFELGKLEWIDFEFKSPIALEEAFYYFDEPVSISKDYNSEYNYYNYDYFSLSVDKKNQLVYSINLFDFSGLKFSKEPIYKILPDAKKLDMFSKLTPGDTTEKDFNSLFPFLKPHKINRFSEDSNYVIGGSFLADNKELSKVVYVFNNGLLSFISIYPKDKNFSLLSQHYGPPLKIETLSKEFTNCQYSNFSVIIDKNNQIKNIGVFSSI